MAERTENMLRIGNTAKRCLLFAATFLICHHRQNRPTTRLVWKVWRGYSANLWLVHKLWHVAPAKKGKHMKATRWMYGNRELKKKKRPDFAWSSRWRYAIPKECCRNVIFMPGWQQVIYTDVRIWNVAGRSPKKKVFYKLKSTWFSVWLIGLCVSNS